MNVCSRDWFQEHRFQTHRVNYWKIPTLPSSLWCLKRECWEAEPVPNPSDPSPALRWQEQSLRWMLLDLSIWTFLAAASTTTNTSAAREVLTPSRHSSMRNYFWIWTWREWSGLVVPGRVWVRVRNTWEGWRQKRGWRNMSAGYNSLLCPYSNNFVSLKAELPCLPRIQQTTWGNEHGRVHAAIQTL